MAQKISSFIFNGIYKISEHVCFLICLGLITLLGIIEVIITLIKGEYKRIDVIRQFFLVFSFLFFEFLHSVILKVGLEHLLINCSVSLFFFAFIFCLPIRGKRIKKEEKELALFIDKQLHLQNLSSKIKEVDDESKKQNQNTLLEVIKPQVSQQETISVPIDYTHVKNVIERLNYFPLSVSDRRQVRDLEGFLVEAESGQEEPSLKSKITDGLSALLKIMSKYGA